MDELRNIEQIRDEGPLPDELDRGHVHVCVQRVPGNDTLGRHSWQHPGTMADCELPAEIVCPDHSGGRARLTYGTSTHVELDVMRRCVDALGVLRSDDAAMRRVMTYLCSRFDPDAR